MNSKSRIYVLGAGAVGLPLAAYLASVGRDVIAVRTTPNAAPGDTLSVHIRNATDTAFEVPIPCTRLSELTQLDGIIVITAKSYANRMIGAALAEKIVTGPLVIMQNGLGVERPFIEAGFDRVLRSILYVTNQIVSANKVTFRQIASCPIGTVRGTDTELGQCVEALATPQFQFHAEENIERAVWKKAIVNVVFNSLCPLLDIDNGIFARDEKATQLADELTHECITLAECKGVSLTHSEVMEQIMRISKGSDGVLISTLQDIRKGRETEVESLNLEMARIASEMQIGLPRTELLGHLIAAKARIHTNLRSNEWPRS